MGLIDLLRPQPQQREVDKLSAFSLVIPLDNKNGSKPPHPSREQLEMGTVVVLYSDPNTTVTFQPHPSITNLAFVSEIEKDTNGVVTRIVNHEWKPRLMTDDPDEDQKVKVFSRTNRNPPSFGSSRGPKSVDINIAPGVMMSPDLLSIKIPKGEIVFDRSLL